MEAEGGKSDFPARIGRKEWFFFVFLFKVLFFLRGYDFFCFCFFMGVFVGEKNANLVKRVCVRRGDEGF